MTFEILLFLAFPVAVGAVAQIFYLRIGAAWAAAALALSLLLVDAVMVGSLRLAWAAPDRIRAVREAIRQMYAIDATQWERILFVLGTAGLSALLVLAVLVTLPAQRGR